MQRIALLAILVGLLIVACGDDAGDAGVVEYDLTAEVVDWTVVDGEVVEVWGYNGQYPGPPIEAEVGDTVRVHLTNNLPEGTTIHWHGLEVPNEQDGVPGITQLMVEPGQRYTYEFEVDRPGTTMYHTHANTVKQLGRGLVGPFVVREKAAKRTPKYDGEYTLVLHEIDGLFTINGHAFPETLAHEDSLISMEEGDRVLVRFVNAGQQHHPMHLHGHQFRVVELDSNRLDNPYWVNTIDVAPGQTVAVEVHGTNPGTWTFHCHILPHVTNRGVYPGGMLTVVDYADHTSMFEGADPPQLPQDVAGATATTEPATAAPEASGAVIDVVGAEFSFSPDELTVEPGEEVTIRLENIGAVEHNLEISEWGVLVEAAAGQTADVTLTVPEDAAGRLEFFCNIAGHREAGMVGELSVET